MTQITRTDIKQAFETGDVPTQSDFENMIDSSFNLVDDSLDDVANGQTNKFVHQTDIDNWNQKTDTGHSHNIADINGLNTELSKKQPAHRPEFIDRIQAAAIQTFVLNSNRFNLFLELPAPSDPVRIQHSVTSDTSADVYHLIMTNANQVPIGVDFNFRIIDMDGQSIQGVPAGMYMVQAGSATIMTGFFANNGTEIVFVAQIKTLSL